MIVECIVGRGDRVFEYWLKIVLLYREEISDVYKIELYVYCQMIVGKDVYKLGEVKNLWLIGFVVWNFVVMIQWILGIRFDFDGFLIDFCILILWEGFKVKRVFRNVIYYIEVKNLNRVLKGVKKVIVDGKEMFFNLIFVFLDGKEYFVEVIMG